jgi:hypothetical protein
LWKYGSGISGSTATRIWLVLACTAGWIFLVSVLAFAGLLSVGEIAEITGQHAVPPNVDVSPPSP